jgi:hypothetical protein
MSLGGVRGEFLREQGAVIRSIQVRLGDNDEKTKWSTPIGCGKDQLGY